MDEAHAGPIDQIDCVSGSVHRRAKTLQAVLALLPLCFNYFERLLVFEIVEGKGQVDCQVRQQLDLFGVEKVRLAGKQGDNRLRPPRQRQWKTSKGLVPPLQQDLAARRQRGFGRNIVADHGLSQPQRAASRGLVFRRRAARTKLDRVDIVLICAVPGDHLAIQRMRIDHTDPRRLECPGFDRNPACLAEQLVAIMHAHDQRIDAALHRVHAIQALDPDLGLLAFGDVRGNAGDAYQLAGGVVDWKASRLDPANRAVWTYDPVLQLKIPRRHFVGVFLVGQCPVIRVDRVAPRVRIRVQAFAALTPDVFVGRTDVQHVIGDRVVEEEHVADVFRHLPESRFARSQSLLRLAMGRAHLRLFQLAFEYRSQSRQALLHQVIAGAGLHRLHRGVLADGAGNKDERNVKVGGTENFERIHAGEARHAEIGDDSVPALPGQRGFQIRRRLHAPVRRVEAATAQGPQCQLRVVLGVLDDEDFYRIVHAIWRSGGG